MRLSKAKSELGHVDTALLRRWAELEPERIWFLPDDGVTPNNWELRLGGEVHGVAWSLPASNQAIVQAAVQEAIHAHSWMFSLTPTFTTNAKDGELISVRYDAMITPTYGDSYRPPVGESPRGYEEASPAEVLLSAYLIALTNFPGETQ